MNTFLQANGNFDTALNFNQILDLLKSGGKMTFVTADKNKVKFEYKNLIQCFEFTNFYYEPLDLRGTLIQTDVIECNENMFITDFYNKINSKLQYLYQQLKINETHYDNERTKLEKLKTFKVEFYLNEYYPKHKKDTYFFEVRNKFDCIFDYTCNKIVIIDLKTENLKKKLQLDENYFKNIILNERFGKNLNDWVDRIKYIANNIVRFEEQLKFLKDNYLEYCL